MKRASRRASSCGRPAGLPDRVAACLRWLPRLPRLPWLPRLPCLPLSSGATPQHGAQTSRHTLELTSHLPTTPPNLALRRRLPALFQPLYLSLHRFTSLSLSLSLSLHICRPCRHRRDPSRRLCLVALLSLPRLPKLSGLLGLAAYGKAMAAATLHPSVAAKVERHRQDPQHTNTTYVR